MAVITATEQHNRFFFFPVPLEVKSKLCDWSHRMLYNMYDENFIAESYTCILFPSEGRYAFKFQQHTKQ